jgi:predicted nucleotide-binding protein (sugar kinase/HSP70/actin superfamily)
VALLTLTSENSYAGLGVRDQLLMLKAIIVADILDDIRNAIPVLSKDKDKALGVFQKEYQNIKSCFRNRGKNLSKVLEKTAKNLSKIEKRLSLKKAKKVLIAGEIYVRKDEFSSQKVIDKLAKHDIVCRRSPVLEWLYYVDYLTKHKRELDHTFRESAELLLRRMIQSRMEKKIKKILARSGFYEYEAIDIEKIMETGSKFIDPALTGETIVITGAFFNEIAKHVHGVISIGPFACLPTRITESILSPESNVSDNPRIDIHEDLQHLKRFHTLPFLSIEADGNPFPQIVEARLEAFSLQVQRIHDIMQQVNKEKLKY